MLLRLTAMHVYIVYIPDMLDILPIDVLIRFEWIPEPWPYSILLGFV